MIINLTKQQQAIGEFLIESNAIEGVYDNGSLLQAFKAWDYLVKQDRMTMAVILETHRILMKGHLKGRDLGNIRSLNVTVGKNRGMDPQFISNALSGWCVDMNLRKIAYRWQELHVEYENIHPFIDGNGRTGRMFMNWHRLHVAKLPVLVIKESERAQYYDWFKHG